MQEHFFMMCLSQLLLIPSRTQVGRCSVLLLYQCLLSNIHMYFHPTFILGWMTAACKLMMMIQLYNVMLTYCFGRFCTMFFWGQRSIMVRGGWSFLLLGGIIIYSLSKQSPPHIMWLENYMRSWSMLILGASIFFTEFPTSWTQVPFPL